MKMKTSPRLVLVAFLASITFPLFAEGPASRSDALFERKLRLTETCLKKGHVAPGDIVLTFGSEEVGVVQSVEGKMRALVQFAPFDSKNARLNLKQMHLHRTVNHSTGISIGDEVEVSGFDVPVKVTHIFEGAKIIVATTKNGETVHYLKHVNHVKNVRGRSFARGISENAIALYTGWTGYYAVKVLSLNLNEKKAVVSLIADDGANPFTVKLSDLYPEAHGAISGISKGDAVGDDDFPRFGRADFVFDNGTVKINIQGNPNYQDRKAWDIHKVD